MIYLYYKLRQPLNTEGIMDKAKVLEMLGGIQENLEARYDKVQADIDECPTIPLLTERHAINNEKLLLKSIMINIHNMA